MRAPTIRGSAGGCPLPSICGQCLNVIQYPEAPVLDGRDLLCYIRKAQKRDFQREERVVSSESRPQFAAALAEYGLLQISLRKCLISPKRVVTWFVNPDKSAFQHVYGEPT